MNKHTIIRLNEVSVNYDKIVALDKINLSVFEKDFLGIIGPNGGGKTTLIRTILGMVKITHGNVEYFKDGKRCNELKIGYLPQYNQIDKNFPISVREVIFSGLSNEKSLLSSYNKYHEEKVKNIIIKLGLRGLEDRPIGELSGGQLQRTLLARATVSSPEVLILDEPNTYIDKKFQQQMYQMLDTINNTCAIIMVSHDIGSILQNVKHVACVNKTLHYHNCPQLSAEELTEHFGCPIELLGHGEIPHRILKNHTD